MTISGALFLVGSIAGALLLSLVARDAHACLPRIQLFLLRQAAKCLPPEKRADAIEAWEADLADLWPSEIVRTFMALDTIRAAYRMQTIVTKPARVAIQKTKKMPSTRDEISAEEMRRQIFEVLRAASLGAQLRFSFQILSARLIRSAADMTTELWASVMFGLAGAMGAALLTKFDLIDYLRKFL